MQNYFLQDDRDPFAGEMEAFPVVVMMTDRFMSGWGLAEGGKSFAGWACRPEDVNTVEAWVRRRGEASRVRVIYGGKYTPSASCRHCHIYVVRPGHPALDPSTWED